MRTILLSSLLLTILAVAGLQGQSLRPLSDSVTARNGAPSESTGHNPRENALGVDIMLSNGGVGLGTFFRHEYSDELSMFLNFSISEAKDDEEREYVDYYGNRYTPGKVNRFLVLPLFIGLQKRLFKDDIVDNFRPYINAAAGPTMIYVFPYNDDYFNALGKGRPKYTAGGYIGFGAYFGSEESNILGVNVRYYFVPYPSGLESMEGVMKKEFGGFFITINFGGPI